MRGEHGKGEHLSVCSSLTLGIEAVTATAALTHVTCIVSLSSLESYFELHLSGCLGNAITP